MEFLKKLLTGNSEAKKENILTQLLQEYPSLNKYNIKYTNSINQPTDINGNPVNGRLLEYYSPRKEDYPGGDWNQNPNSGSPTIEQFSPKMTKDDALGEIFSHYLPKVEPLFKKGRDQFIGSITPKQLDDLRGDYEQQVKNRVFEGEYGKGKYPTFHEWVNRWGGDAFFRGYPSKQYPESMYTPEQKEMLNNLMNAMKYEEIPDPTAMSSTTPSSYDPDFYSGMNDSQRKNGFPPPKRTSAPDNSFTPLGMPYIKQLTNPTTLIKKSGDR